MTRYHMRSPKINSVEYYLSQSYNSLNSVLRQIDSYSGGMVFVPQGRYLEATSSIIYPMTTIAGAGKGATTLVYTDSTTRSGMEVYSSSAIAQDVVDFNLKDIKLMSSGSKMNLTVSCISTTCGRYYTIDNVRFDSWGKNAIYFNGVEGGNWWGCSDVIIHHCNFDRASLYSTNMLYYYYGFNSEFSGNSFGSQSQAWSSALVDLCAYNSLVENNCFSKSYNAISVNNCDNVLVQCNFFIDTDETVGISNPSNNVTVRNNLGENCGYCITVDGSSPVKFAYIEDNIFWKNDNNPPYVGFFLKGNMTGARYIDNYCLTGTNMTSGLNFPFVTNSYTVYSEFAEEIIGGTDSSGNVLKPRISKWGSGGDITQLRRKRTSGVPGDSTYSSVPGSIVWRDNDSYLLVRGSSAWKSVSLA